MRKSAAHSSASWRSRAWTFKRRPRSPWSTSGNEAEGDGRAGRRRHAETIEADMVLVAIGRVPYTEGSASMRPASTMDKRGRVKVDAHFATNVPGIYAIGDVIAGPDARAQGRGRRRRRRGAHRRPGRPRELRRHPECRLHLPESPRSANRGGAQGRRHRIQRRQVSVHRQRPRQGQRCRPTAS